MTEAADIAVVGSGPAGSAAAIALASRGCRVVLVDDVPGRRRWQVGETLAGDAWGSLEALDVEAWLDTRAQLPSVAIASAWGSDEVVVTPAITNPHGGGWHLDRDAFDRMLVDRRREAAGARVWRRTRATALARDAGGFDLAGSGTGRSRRIRARDLLDATGSARWAARRLGSEMTESPHRQVGLAARLTPSSAAEPWPPALLLEACEGGWWYSVPVPGRHAVAVFVTDGDLLPRGRKPELAWRAALRASTHTRERLGGHRVRAFQVHSCGTSRLSHLVGAGWAAIGGRRRWSSIRSRRAGSPRRWPQVSRWPKR